ncbi:30S ribosomal protein S1 [Planctomycetes bacterium Pan216]|uniref:30S ribosomal protein S1 n=1 Tax=Kolteria novifilia TaxID=2527975 RepID=A0A518B1Q3_9BACT|nr:30S ribosomal protein S1 [Planctomycetes bacterium Pan216]
MEEHADVDLGRLAQDLQLKRRQVEAAVRLLDEGNTAPFMARFRKEETGNLGEEQIREVQHRVAKLRQLAERRQTILRTLEAQGNLTDELRTAIAGATSPKRLEDLYLPFKPKKQTLATQARERGLGPLASAIWTNDEIVRNFDEVLEQSVDAERQLATTADVRDGLKHILAEMIAENAEVREAARIAVWEGRIVTTRSGSGDPPPAKVEPSGEDDAGHPDVDHTQGEFRNYFSYNEPLRQVPPHRILAINRGEKLGIIKVRIDVERPKIIEAIRSRLPLEDHPHAAFLIECAEDGLDRLLLRSLEREVRTELTDVAEEHAIGVFARNLRNLLLQPPIRDKRVLAIDPGYRTGCKYAVLDEIGNPLAEGVFHPHARRKKKRKKRKRSGDRSTPTAAATPDGAIDAVSSVSDAESIVIMTEAPQSYETLISTTDVATAPLESLPTESPLENAPQPTGEVESSSPETQSEEEKKPTGDDDSESSPPILPADSFHRSTDDESDEPDQTPLEDMVSKEPEPKSEPTSEAIAEPTSEVIAGPTSEAATDSTSEAATDATSEAATDATSEAATDATSEAATDSTSEAATDATSEAATDSTSEAATDSTSEAIPEPTAGPASESEPTETTPEPATPAAPEEQPAPTTAESPVAETAPEGAPSESPEPSAPEPAAADDGAASESTPVAEGSSTPPPTEGHEGEEPPMPQLSEDVDNQMPRRERAKRLIAELCRLHRVSVVAIGNGSACRETEELIAEVISDGLADFEYCIVNEAGAAAYSTSAIGREEFPNLDATARGTISIGRRLQDPLSELVKIDPQNIGVGLYQHDINPKLLREKLSEVVESCVNYVGVDLNTASVPLLQYVSGLNQLRARNIVEYRKEQGPFPNREKLKEVPGVGPAVFTQAAGFLKITGSDQPFDGTWIHPESYSTAEKILEQLQETPATISDRSRTDEVTQKLAELDREATSAAITVSVTTVDDLVANLARPGRDPREDLPGPIFRRGILKLEDLSPEMELRGTVLNVVDFGVFVDVGLKDSALVHISQMADRFVRSPHDLVSVGNIVTTWVLSVDLDRRRVSLTMIPPEQREQRRERRPKRGRKPQQSPQASEQSDQQETRTEGRSGGRGRRPSQRPQGRGQQRRRPQTASPPSVTGKLQRSSAPGAEAYSTRSKRRDKVELSDEALEGKQVLHTFGELKALFEAKKDEPDDTKDKKGKKGKKPPEKKDDDTKAAESE